MFMYNVVFYYYRAKLCVRQILPVIHPRFSPPMQHVTDVRDVMSLLEKGSVAFELPPFSHPLLSRIYILANVHWVSLLKVIELSIHCLCYERSYHPLTKVTLCPPTYARIVGILPKTFFRNTGETYADKQ